MSPNLTSLAISAQWAVPQSDSLSMDSLRSPSDGSPTSQPDSGLHSPEASSEDELECAEKPNAKHEVGHRPLASVKSVERQGRRTSPIPYQKPSPSGNPKQGAKQEEQRLQHLEKVATTASDAQRWHQNLLAALQEALSVEKFSDFKCVSEAKRLVEVTRRMTMNHQLHHFLRVFGHSVSCQDSDCVKPCLMFRRIRGHLVSLDHECAIVHVYSQLTRLHVDTCVTEKCGFPTCKGLQAYRARAKNEVLPRDFYVLERENARSLTKNANEKCIELTIKKENDDSNKENEMTKNKAAANGMQKQNVALKPTVKTLKTEIVEETTEAMDLTQRVSKLEMCSPNPEASVRM